MSAAPATCGASVVNPVAIANAAHATPLVLLRCTFFMASSPWDRSARRWLRRRQGFQVRYDGVDLRRLEIELEARHARRAVEDHLAYYLVAAASGFLRQRRTKGRGDDLRLEVADAARLGEVELARLLLLGERCGLRVGAGCEAKKQ